MAGLALGLLSATGCTTPPDGEYCACAEHGKPSRCVVLEQDGEDVDIELKIDGKSAGTMSAKYEAKDGYGHAATDMGELEVSLGRTVLGVGKQASSASFKGDRAGVFNFSVLSRDQSCP